MTNSPADVWNPKVTVKFDADDRTASETFTATLGQTIFNLLTFSYALDNNSLAVYKNGQRLVKGTEWGERTATSFSVVASAAASDVYVAVGVVGTTIVTHEGSLINRTLYNLGTEAASSSHEDITVGHIIETNYINSLLTVGSGSEVAFTGAVDIGKASQWPNTDDGKFYDLNGKQFEVILDLGILNLAVYGAVINGDIASIYATAQAAGHDNVILPQGNFNYTSQLNVGNGKLVGSTTQLSTITYTGVSDIVSVLYSSGAIIQDLKILGPWASGRDVTTNLVGISDSASVVAPTGQSNRAVLRNVRVELFGVNYWFKNTQNILIDDVFAQYAKYKEYHFEDTENTFATKVNANGTEGLATISSDASYKWIHADNARNLRITDGIMERAIDIVGPVLFENGTRAALTNVEFNAATDYIVNTTDTSELILASPAFTASGLGELLVKAEDSSECVMQSPTLSGSGGAHLWSLVSGNVRDARSESSYTFHKTPLSRFVNTSGGTGVMNDGVLEVVGAGSAQGVFIQDKTSNAIFSKATGDNLGGFYVDLEVSGFSGATKMNVYLLKPSPSFRRKIGEVTAIGHTRIPVTLEDEDSLNSIGLGVEWDGSTVDPDHGNNGVVTLVGRRAVLTRA
ncbi:MAG: hypothetical protein COB66_01295 [Coxiella sp. (in: Bacteria)]|nr:MAG: hypothetical protein COB66_01295 [Coxiella sp. (in: g-proteobacteria)]